MTHVIKLTGLETRCFSRGPMGPPRLKTWWPKPKSGWPEHVLNEEGLKNWAFDLTNRGLFGNFGGHLEISGVNGSWAPASFEP